MKKALVVGIIVLFIGMSITPSTGNISKTSFICKSNNPPYEPSNPIPPDGATNATPFCVAWTGGDPDGDLVIYDVYFGNTTPPPKVLSNISFTIYCHTGGREFNTTYYWKIVAWDKHGASTAGPIWHFTTELEPIEPPTSPDINGPTSGAIGVEYCWTFQSEDPNGDNIKYIIFSFTNHANI